jgi:hypothetical protein
LSTRFLAALLFVSSIAHAPFAHADQPVCTELPDANVRARLNRLELAVERHEPAMRRWWSSFALLHTTMASVSGILAATARDENFRNEMLVGMTSSTLALLTILVSVPPLMGGGDRLRSFPDRTPEERLHKLRQAERLLAQSASATDFVRSWLPATLSALYVTAAAGTLLLAFQRPSGAITHSVGGALLGMGRILLHPYGARDVWRRYLRDHPDADCTIEAPRAASYEPSVQIVAHAIGLGIRIDF